MDETAQFWVLLLVVALSVTVVVPILTILAVGGIAGWIGGTRARVAVWLVLVTAYALSPLPRIALGLAYYAAEPLRIPMVRLDLALSHVQREEIVRMVQRDELPAGRYASLELPAWARGLSVHGTVEPIDGDCGVFFLTLTGMSPDPYAGFEYVQEDCTPEADPLGSGHGVATDLGDHWFWIVAR